MFGRIITLLVFNFNVLTFDTAVLCQKKKKCGCKANSINSKTAE